MTDAIRAKKSLGQNFLVNEGILDRIVVAARLVPGDTVLEVGPGKGALTARLLSAGAKVIAVEKDRRLIEPLREQFGGSLDLREGDILAFNPSSAGLTAGAYTVVANIPYYLTSHLLRQMWSVWPPPRRAVLMVQREVARRIVATPPEMSLLALSVQLATHASVVCTVSRGSFRPMPGVDSAVILLEPRNDAAPSADREAVIAVAKGAFAGKRKQLKASIPADALSRAGVVPSARPQELTVAQWEAIARALL